MQPIQEDERTAKYGFNKTNTFERRLPISRDVRSDLQQAEQIEYQANEARDETFKALGRQRPDRDGHNMIGQYDGHRDRLWKAQRNV